MNCFNVMVCNTFSSDSLLDGFCLHHFSGKDPVSLCCMAMLAVRGNMHIMQRKYISFPL